MKFLVILALVGAALAAPQESDAEFIGGGGRRRFNPFTPPVDGGDGGGDDGGDTGVRIRWIVPLGDSISFSDFLRGILGGSLTPIDERNATDSDVPVRADDDQPSSGFPFRFPFPNIFTQRPTFNIPSFPQFPSIFPNDGSSDGDSFPDGSSIFPGGPSEFPDNYDNSTHEVKIINGTRVEMNSTVTKQTGDDGNIVFRHFHVVRTLPGDDQVPAQIPDATENEVLDGSEVPNSRSRRWVLEWLKNNAHNNNYNLGPLFLPFRHPNAISGYVHKMRGSGESAEGDRAVTDAPRRVLINPYAHIPVDSNRHTPLDSNTHSPADSNRRTPLDSNTHSPTDSDRRTLIDNLIPIRNHDDIAVNYVGVTRPVNPDAEIFDIDLVMENERRFHADRSQPLQTQPIVSEPIRSQPIRSEPLAYEPRHTQPIRSESSHPVRYQRPRRTYVSI